MRIVQITPGAGAMYCGNCLRDNSLVKTLRGMGHDTLLVPLYLPMTLEEDAQATSSPIFFSGINVYLGQLSPLFRHMPGWIRRVFTAPLLLKWAAARAAKTRAQDLGSLTVSMLEGEQGFQKRDLDELLAWLQGQNRPDVICLSNALLAGMIRRLREVAPVACMLQGEAAFLDGLSPSHRDLAWRVLSERIAEADALIAPSQYFARAMAQRLHLDPARLRVVYNGIDTSGYAGGETRPGVPVLGFFARMCPEKGLHLLVQAFIELKNRDCVPGLRLSVGGGMTAADEPYVRSLKERLAQAGWSEFVAFHPNATREEKLTLLRTFTVMSVPALYGEAFGLYVVEAWASGVPVVQPKHAAFPELIDLAKAGVLTDLDPLSLARGIERLLLDPDERDRLARNGRQAVHRWFSTEQMASGMLEVFQSVRSPAAGLAKGYRGPASTSN